MKKLFICMAALILSCTSQQDADTKIWAWMVGKTTTTAGQWDYYFQKASEAGIDAILLECHGGYPEEIPADADGSSSLQTTQPFNHPKRPAFAQKYGIELHA